jgi:hypothetical protein
VRRCYFVGGPFDGAWIDRDRDGWLPSSFFLRHDPEQRMEFGLILSLLPHVGSERYILSSVSELITTYLHESIHVGGPVRKLQEVA